MSRARFAPSWGPNVSHAIGGTYSNFVPAHVDGPAVDVAKARAAAASVCHIKSCHRPAYVRVYVKGGAQIGACSIPLHQAAMRARQWPKGE